MKNLVNTQHLLYSVFNAVEQATQKASFLLRLFHRIKPDCDTFAHKAIGIGLMHCVISYLTLFLLYMSLPH